eukprot:gene27112-35831_t
MIIKVFFLRLLMKCLVGIRDGQLDLLPRQFRLRLSPELFSVSIASEDGRQVIRGRVVRDSSLLSSFTEEERSKQPSLFSLVRSVRELFLQPRTGGRDTLSGGPGQQQFGLVGAFGYDLAFQFEPVPAAASKQQRAERDLLLFLPDEILVVDGHSRRGEAWKVRYDFASAATSASTAGLPRDASKAPFRPAAESSSTPFRNRELPKGDYAKTVERAKEQFKVGNLFEVVLSQLFSEPLRSDTKPSHIFNRLLKRNPSPYGFFMNLGRDEYLIGASPEMFVRVEGAASGSLRIETCPISGTIERGSDPLEDALQIRKLLSSVKEESELTMCTDVDRNDKSRICEPGSVKVLGRRQIELYSKLIHTVDHVEALDAFLCHTWAVTVTGAPKTWAMRFIEQSEPGLRHWYGGAVGIVSFDGSLNTGLTLRTIRVKNGVAEVRAGATLLHESDPLAEEAETELKASALLDAIRRPDLPVSATTAEVIAPVGKGKLVLLVDHEDSFVHTLANYLRQAGATVLTLRSGRPFADFLQSKVDSGAVKPDLVVLSPGPGSPDDFNLKTTISSVLERKLPLFGVCLGLQALVEYYGGKLQVLDTPMHGKPSLISRSHPEEGDTPISDGAGAGAGGEGSGDWDVLNGLPAQFEVARYHSLYGERATLPAQLRVTASAPDGVIMALQHASLPIAAVQFHPESILTLPKHGMQIINNALTMLTADKFPSTEQ